MLHVSRSSRPARSWSPDRSTRTRFPALPGDGAAFAVTTAAGDTRIVLAGTDGALYVERTQVRRRSQTRTIALFEDLVSFDAWADDLPLRFDDPRVHLEIKRHARRFLPSA